MWRSRSPSCCPRRGSDRDDAAAGGAAGGGARCGHGPNMGMRIVGVAENMSYLVGTGQEIFGSGGGQRLADEIGVPLLGSIPLDPALREAADAGTPVLEAAPAAEATAAIVALAERLRKTGRARSASR